MAGQAVGSWNGDDCTDDEYVESTKKAIEDYRYWGEHPNEPGRHAECWKTIRRLISIIDRLKAKPQRTPRKRMTNEH